MTQICNAFSLFGCHELSSNLRTPVLTTQWRQKCRLAEKSKKKLLITQNFLSPQSTGQEGCV